MKPWWFDIIFHVLLWGVCLGTGYFIGNVNGILEVSHNASRYIHCREAGLSERICSRLTYFSPESE